MKKIKPIIDIIIITFIFIILLTSFKPFWPGGWHEAAQATLAAAITAGIVSILGIYLKFIFNQMNSEAEYNKKISEKLISNVHNYAESYYLPLGMYANLFANQLDRILTKAKDSTEEKQLALFYITKYFKYRSKLEIEKGGIVLFQNFDSESLLEQLNVKARDCLKRTPTQVCRLQKSIELDDTFLDFSLSIQNDNELTEIYKKFEEWLKNNDDSVKKTIKYLKCYAGLMTHELNLIYYPWYKKKPLKISPQCKAVRKAFKNSEKTRFWKKITERYLKMNMKKKEKEELNKPI